VPFQGRCSGKDFWEAPKGHPALLGPPFSETAA
jgi:hypothetical protein